MNAYFYHKSVFILFCVSFDNSFKDSPIPKPNPIPDKIFPPIVVKLQRYVGKQWHCGFNACDAQVFRSGIAMERTAGMRYSIIRRCGIVHAEPVVVLRSER